MTRRRRTVLITSLSAVAAVLGVAGWFGYRLLYTVSHIHEAYAAWDTGTLLVEYMTVHDDSWRVALPATERRPLSGDGSNDPRTTMSQLRLARRILFAAPISLIASCAAPIAVPADARLIWAGVVDSPTQLNYAHWPQY